MLVVLLILNEEKFVCRTEKIAKNLDVIDIEHLKFKAIWTILLTTKAGAL